MLRQLILSKKIEQKRAAIMQLKTRESEIKTRDEGIESAITEATTDEEIALVEDEIAQLEKERTELESEISTIESEIIALEEELNSLNSKSPTNKEKTTETEIEREGADYMRRGKYFGIMTRTAAEMLVTREEVKDFLERTREMITEKRAVKGAELNVPDVMLDVLRDNINIYSKLISKVYLKKVKGKARQTIAGAIPEAIWTEACGNLNELNIIFNQLEVEGYKVGGFIPLCNSNIEDSDLDLAQEVFTALGQAIGFAIDKAILYGTGTKMPVGIVKRLSETTQPAYYGKNERAWKNLVATNLLVSDPTATTDLAFFKDLTVKLGVIKSEYSNDGKFWAMNETTHATLKSRALGVNAAGAIVAGMENTMPIVGGDIIILNFIPNDHIIGGYGSLYILAERAGTNLAQSEHVHFIQDNTVFRGTARYDGRPIFGEAFVAINIKQDGVVTAPSPTDITFAADSAN